MLNDLKDSQHFSAKKLIITAFTCLLSPTSFEKITVQQIVKKAGVSRSTFYLHFQDKYDLLSQLTEDITEEFLQFYRNPILSVEKDLQNNIKEQTLLITLKICEHIQFYKNFYINRFKDPEFVAYFTKRLHLQLQNKLQDNALASFAAFGTVGYIGKWLEEELQTSTYEVAMQLKNIGRFIAPSSEMNS